MCCGRRSLGIVNGQVFDENFLMALATVGAYRHRGL